MKPVDIIFARDINFGIGILNSNNEYELPSNINVDMKYFNCITSITSKGIPNKYRMNAVIMGKNTWQSINVNYKPLPNRVNIIISSTMDNKSIENYNNTFICNTFDDAINFANNLYYVETIFIIGGAQLYNYAFENLNFRYSYETIIYKDFNCNIKINNYGGKYIFDKKTFSLKNLTDNENISVDFIKSVNIKYCSSLNLKIHKLIPPNINTEEQNYINCLEELLKDGDLRQTRNSYTWSSFNKILTFDLENGFPLLTTKKVNLNSIAEELFWFLSGNTNAKILNDKGIKIWNGNTSREFLDNNGLSHYDEFDTGPMYGFNLNHFGAQYNGMDENYSNKGFNQLEYVIDLIKRDPMSRRIVMTTFNPAQAKEGVLYPCHGLVTQFYVRNNRLDLITYQRSADYFLGLPFNIASYALLCHLICEVVNNDPNYTGKILIPGKITIHLGDYHLYNEHYDQAILQILRRPFGFPKLLIKNKKQNLSDFKMEDLELVNYVHHSSIIAKMIA